MKNKLIIFQKNNFDYITMDFKNTNLTVDLQELNFITSVELSIIARWFKQSNNLKIINVSKYVKKVFKITGFERFINE